MAWISIPHEAQWELHEAQWLQTQNEAYLLVVDGARYPVEIIAAPWATWHGVTRDGWIFQASYTDAVVLTLLGLAEFVDKRVA